jgi:hypothetical protein
MVNTQTLTTSSTSAIPVVQTKLTWSYHSEIIHGYKVPVCIFLPDKICNCEFTVQTAFYKDIAQKMRGRREPVVRIRSINLMRIRI